MQQDIEEETKEFLQKFGHLLYAKVIWDMYTGNLTPRLTAVMQRYHPAERDSCTRYQGLQLEAQIRARTLICSRTLFLFIQLANQISAFFSKYTFDVFLKVRVFSSFQFIILWECN